MKKSLPSVLALSLIISNFSPTLSVFANEWQTQVKVSEEETKENEKWYKKVQNFIVKHKVPFIIGGTILVVAVGSTTYIIIKKRRRSII